MSDTIRVIDLSEWTGPVPVQNARRMAEEYNVEGVILQAWGSGHVPGRRNEYFHQAVDAFRAAGITNIDPYIWPPSGWRQALDWVGDYKRFMSGAVYLDVEVGAGVTDGIISGVRAAGWEPRIYASPSSWSSIMSNTTRYRHLKLWLARYLLRFQLADGYYRPGFDVIFPAGAFGGCYESRVGGWGNANLVGWQTTGTVPNFCGESVDCSIFHRNAFKQEEEDDMVSQADFNKLREDMEAVNKFQNEIIIGHKAAIDLHSDIVIDLARRLEGLSGLVSLLEAKIERPGNSAGWLGALTAHSSDTDAHHE